MAVDIGPRVGVDGEAEYRKQINNIIQASKTLAAEMKAVTSSFDANTTAEEKAEAKGKILSQQIETQKERVKLLADMLAKSAEKYGENDTKTLKWKEALANATTELNNMEKESDELGTSVEDLGDDLDDTGEKTVTFGEMLKANLTSEAVIAGVKAIASAVVEIGKAVAGVVQDAVEQYAEYEQLVGGVETLFKDSAGEVQDYARNAWKTAGMTANDYMDTAVSFSAALISGLEGDTEKAARVTDMAISDMSDNWNKMGSAPEAVMDAYAGFAKQQYTLLDNLKLGYGGTKSEMERLLADAESFSGVHYDIDNLADVYEAIHVIQGELGITGTTALEASSTISGSTAAMKAAWQNLVVGFADSNADLDSLINDVVTSAETAFGNILPVVEQALAGLAGFVEQIAPMIAERLPALVETVLPGLLSAVSTLVTSLVSALPGVVSVLMEQAPVIIGTFINAILTAGTTMMPEIVSMGVDMVISLATSLISSVGEIVAAYILE